MRKRKKSVIYRSVKVMEVEGYNVPSSNIGEMGHTGIWDENGRERK
jgi:hypothetical protein